MKVNIIVGTDRPGRATDRVAKWVAAEARNLEDTQVELVDLADYKMPLFNEPVSPRYNQNRQPHPEVQRWLDTMAEADAYVFVTAEYNHSMPAVLKNAIDYLTYEMAKKPAAVVGHGTVGGARAIVALKEVISEAQATLIPEFATLIGLVGYGTILDENGVLIDEAMAGNPHGPQSQLKGLLANLKWHSDALSATRQ